jgi:methyl-accepting chemotaxis protein
MLFEKHVTARAFKGNGYFSWLSFQGKIYAAAIVLLIGILLEGCIIFIVNGESQNQTQKCNFVKEQALKELNKLIYFSPAILSRCQAGLEEGSVVETTDIRDSLSRGIGHLKKLVGHDYPFTSLVKNYRILSHQLGLNNNSTLSMPQYLKIKKSYHNYGVSLNDLGKQIRSYHNVKAFSLINQGWLLLGTLVVIIATFALSSILLIAAVQSIVAPAQFMANTFNEAKQKIFKVELPITSNEGLGNFAFILKESLTHWNSEFLDSKNSICRFDQLCKELLTEIRKTELFAIQLQKVSEELTQNFDDQSQLIKGVNDQLTVLVSNSEELHKVPQRLTVIHDTLKTQLTATQEQIKDILSQTFEYRDESREIADLAENLNVASEKVKEVIAILNDVAERTELLAFNTAIQAARAGDKGLGFGVVAKEIAKLVDYSKKASLQLTEMLNKINGKNEYILKLIQEYSGPSNIQSPVSQEVARICEDLFKTAHNNFEDIEKLTKLMEIIFIKSNRLSNETHQIARLTHEENIGQVKFDLDTLDYQLNVKEANRIALKVCEISDELRILAETATTEEEVLF